MGQQPSNSRQSSLESALSDHDPNVPPYLTVTSDDIAEHSDVNGSIRRSKSSRSILGIKRSSSTKSNKSDLKVDTNPFRNGTKSKKGSGDNFLSPTTAESTGRHRRSRSADARNAHSQESEPPPAYVPYAEKPLPGTSSPVSLSPTRVSAASRSGPGYMPGKPVRRNSVENALATLRKYNTVFIVDDSGSMRGLQWFEARDVFAGLASIAQQYDTDGVDILFLNSKQSGYGLKGAGAVQRLFDSVLPTGQTPIGERLELLLLDYLDKLERAKDKYDAGDRNAMAGIKPINYIIITDGSPTDDPEEVIVSAARRLDARHFPLSQVGIQFVQIGNYSSATRFLRELDDSLSTKHRIRDMVDTTPYTGTLTVEKLTKILLGGINRRVDRRGGMSVLED